jgi:C4-dicarboxylate transporter
MDAIENIALMVLLLVAGAGIAAAVLCGFVYYMEVQDDR